MLNKKMLLSILMIGMVATVAGAGTWASFSDTGTSSGNTMTAGTLDMVLANNNDDFSDDVIATWASPAGFKPGDNISSVLKFSNNGTVDSHHIWFYLEGVNHASNGDSSNLMNAIIITDLHERFNGVTTGNQATTLATQVGDHDNILTLAEFCSSAYYTFDDQSTDDDVIAAGNQEDYDLFINFQFSPAAGNEYQGDSCTFNMKTVATQNTPTEGMIPLHE